MFNNNLPVSSLFCKISLLHLASQSSCMHTLHFLFFFLLCSVLHSRSMPLFSSGHTSSCTSPPSSCMHHPLQQQQQLQQQQKQHLFSVPCTYSFCAPCACNVHNTSAYSHHANILHLSSALPDHHNSSTSLVVPSTCPTSLGVLLRFLSLSGS
jgi:hypothetical protein